MSADSCLELNPPLVTPGGSSNTENISDEHTYVFPAPGRGHARSVSHGGGISITTSTGTERRPSALKNANRGHQRAMSHGQIVDGTPTRPGHNRVGSKTDFILPPGHKEPDPTHPTSAISAGSVRGHSRQASRSESIYTLRRSEVPSWWRRLLGFLLRRSTKLETDDTRRIVVPNHMVPPKTPRKEHPNGKRVDNKVRTTKYTFLSFLPKNLLEQFHRIANLYFIFIVLLNWFPAINAFGKEIAMIPVIFVLGVTAVKDLFEDRRRRASDKRINNSTCRVYKSESERYKKVLWRDVRVGDLIHLSNNEIIPADMLLLRSSDPNGLCYIDTCNLDGETNLKQRQVARGFVDKQDVFTPSKFTSRVEVDAPTTKIYRFHGAIIHNSGERVPVTTENLLLRECRLKNTDFIEGLVVYAGHETKAMLNNGGPRYKRSKLERQMNVDVIWCVIILVVLCVIGAVGSRLWLTSFVDPVRNIVHGVPFLPFEVNPTYEGLLTFWTYIIILQIMIPLSLYVTIELSKILQVFHIHNNVNMYDPLTNKRTECRALNITEELGQVQYIFSDKTGTLTENKMIFRRCAISGVDYNHPSREQVPPRPISATASPVEPNVRLLEDLSQYQLLHVLDKTTNRNTMHAQRIQEFLVVLAVCNTVVVAQTPHRDLMNASGVIEAMEESARPRIVVEPLEQCPEASSTSVNKSLNDRYTRLTESRSITPSPPLNAANAFPPNVLNLKSNDTAYLRKKSQVPSLTPISSVETTPTTDTPRFNPRSPIDELDTPPTRPKILKIPFMSKNRHSNKDILNSTSNSSSPCESRPIFEAESPDELALVDAAFSYNCRLISRTPQNACVSVPGQGLIDFDILHILPFDSTRKCMSIVLRHPVSRDIILYTKGADSTILPCLAPFDHDSDMRVLVERTQTHLNAYGRQGLRVLVMAKKKIPHAEYAEWLRKHNESELATDSRERRIRESYCKLESNLTLLGCTGIEDRLQEGVPETISALLSAGIVIWVLTGDKPETAINVSYSAKLFSPQMDVLKLMARSKDAAEATILFYLNEIENQGSGGDHTLPGVSTITPNRMAPPMSAASSVSQINPRIKSKTRALVVDGKTLTFILDRRSNLTKPFLTLTKYCSSVLCCRATPLQKAYIVRVVKEELNMRTLAIGDGANDVSMIQTADVGVGISGQEGMQAVMAADFALSRFKFLERFLLVHGHWCYDRLARMILYFFYKNACFVFLIFWYQLFCGFSGAVMIDQMYLMLYNLVFTSMPPLAIGVYDRDVPEHLLISRPYLYSQGRLGLSYRPYSFWITMADALYQSIVIYFVAQGAYEGSDVGIWEFGTTITSTSIFVMLLHVIIEMRSWTILHVLSLMFSLGSFYVFSLVYNSICIQFLSLPSNYWVIHQAMGSPVYWLVIILSVVLALLPRLFYRTIQSSLYPNDATRVLIQTRKDLRNRGEDLLVSWSRSTSASSIYRTTDHGAKDNTMTAVG